MTLDELYTALINANKTGKLNLVPGVLSNVPIANFYQKLYKNNPFIIEGATIEKSSDSKMVSIKNGKASILGIDALPVDMDFTAPNGYLASKLNGLVIDGKWDIGGIDWFSIGNPFVDIYATNSNMPVFGSIGGQVDIGIPLTLQMKFPIVQNEWVLEASFENNYPSIANFCQFIGGINIANVLPAPINAFTDIGVSGLSMVYDSEAQSVSSIGLVLKTNKSWDLFGNLTLNALEISLNISNPGDSSTRDTDVSVNGYFNIGDKDPVTGKYPNTIKANAVYPPFVMTVGLIDGTIQLGDLLTMFLPSVEIDLKSEITAFYMQIDPTGKQFILNCAVVSNWIFLDIKTPISLSFAMTGMGLEINSQQGNTSGKFYGTFHIGPSSNGSTSGVDLTLSAGYQNKAWTFDGRTGKGQTISLTDMAYTFLKPFGIDSLPTWVNGVELDIKDVFFVATLPDANAGKVNKYEVGGNVLWALNFNSFNLSVDASVDIIFSGNTSSGTITGKTKLMGLEFVIGYKFGDSKDVVFLQWKGIQASYTHNSQANTDIIEVKFSKMSLGDIITDLIASFDPGFQLSAPWNVLNSIDLNGLSFTYTRNLSDSTKDKLEISYNNAVDLGFLKISKISLTKDNEGVFLGFEGTFLGLPIATDNPTTKALAGKGSDVRKMPGVPGMGSEFFDLKFLGLGQHIELVPVAEYKTVSDAIEAMSGAFTNPEANKIPIKAGTGGPLVFNENTNWLIGADFTVAKFYQLAFVFNDPNLYGLHVGITKDAEFLKNLQFEILYKKINDSIGVYDVELQLPDVFRHLEFGEVSVTLPNIGVKIYTNGNFYIDLGWPVSIKDFSRSFAIQVFPFLGMGGFYFGYLSGATATGLPAVKKGVFNPVIEAGLALSVGVGKTIDEGILKAGLSLTAVGIFQGILATYTANPDTVYSGQVDHYYKFQGTLALVGQIYGEVNFAIISASFNITAYISVTLIIESYMAIPINFEAGVSVSLSVKINLGLFKITIHLGFSTTIHADFVIGSNHTQDALWYKADQLFLANALAMPENTPVTLKWQPITIDTGDTYGLYLYFIPHLTLSGEDLSVPGFKHGPQYVGMTYIDTSSANPGKFSEFGMTALAKGSLYWALNAIAGSGQNQVKLSWLKDQEVTANEIGLLLSYFNTRPNNEAPFNYKNSSGNDIENFLKGFFSIQVAAIDSKISSDITASVFPMFPELQMNTTLNGTTSEIIDFAKQSMTGTGDYIKDITALLKALTVSYESQITKDYYKPDCSNVTDADYEDQPNLSMPTFIFTDFIAMVIKQQLQKALDYMNAQDKASMKIADIVNGVTTTDNVQQLGGMASRFMLHGLRLPAPPNAVSGEVRPLYVLTGQQFTIPPLSAKDAYQVNLKNPATAWINFVNPVNGDLEVHVTSDEIQRIQEVGAITLTPAVQSGYPRAIVNCNSTPQNFSLGGNTMWDYPGNLFDNSTKPTLWKVPSNFLSMLQENKKTTLDFSLLTLTSNGKTTTKDSIKKYKWATSIRVSLQQITAQDLLNTPVAGNIYSLVGADDASISLLESLIIFMNTQQGGNGGFISQVQFLMNPDSTKGGTGFVSAENGKLNAAIVQANLSTETNPSQVLAFAMLKEQDEPTCNTLNKPEDFVKLLWECSIVRSGGYYFYYITPDDGKGLPSYLFSETGTAEIQVILTYDGFIPQPFINSVVTGDDLDFSKTAVYAQSPDVTVLVPTLLPGSVGYELIRNYPGDYNPASNPPTIADDQVYLQHQFNLLGVTVPSVEGYVNYMPAGPVDTMSEEEIERVKSGEAYVANLNAPWNYTSVIPYYKFVDKPQPDADYPNPYAGIGTSVKMQLNWQDMFGNMPTSGVSSINVSMDLLYTDSIVALSQWPSMSAFFMFQPNGKQPGLLLSFWFDTSRYAAGGESAQNKAKIDLQTYMTLYYQLISGDMSMFYNASIDAIEAVPEGTARIIDVSDLTIKLIKPIVDYLKEVAGGHAVPDPSAIPMPYQISSVVDPSSVASYDDALPLVVTLTMKRIRNVDPNFINEAGVAIAVSTLKPQLKPDQNKYSESDTLALTYFASNFEAAFKDLPDEGILLKVATATNLSKNSSDTDKIPPLWFVRFDSTGANGIKYTYDNSKVFFFAPRPLSTSLISVTTQVNPYETGKAYPAGQGISKSFSSVDLDNWGKLFLEAVDAFLAPGLAVPAFLLDNGESLKKVLDAKKTLAEAIENSVDFIIDADKTGANIGNAQEKWKQQLLIELASAYKYTAAIQTPVSIQSLYKGINDEPAKPPYAPKLYGNMVGMDPSVPDIGQSEAPSIEYALSTAKLPMAFGKSWLTYMFEAKDTPEFRNFEFGNMKFAVSHMETNIKNIRGMGDYLASSWLTFVIPLDDTLSNIGPIIIPNPLRSYPVPPSVMAQSFIYLHKEDATTMEQARTWDYTYSYLNSVAAQDTIETQIEMNIPSTAQLLRAGMDNEIRLDEALAQFINVYPAINADFQSYLSQLTPVDVKDKTSVFVNAQCAVNAFKFIIQQAADAWKLWNPVISGASSSIDTDSKITLQYTIAESGQKGTGYLEVAVSAAPGNRLGIIPVIEIPGYTRENISDSVFSYKDQDGKYLMYENRNKEPLRNLVMQDLDILKIQNVWGGALVSRNKDLIPDESGGYKHTNTRFVYQTPLVKFYTKLISLLNCSSVLDISSIGTKTYPVVPNRSLDANIAAMFDALTEGADSDAINLKLQCSYAYLIEDTKLAVELPVFLVPPFSLSTADHGSSYAKEFTSNLKSWFTSHISGRPAGSVLITLEVFSTYDPNIPIFHLPLKLKL
jgi:hypothetical protein